MSDLERSLAEWREAERRLENAVDGDREALQAEVERARDAFQQLSAAHMMERIDALRDAEMRRVNAAPSSPTFHAAARDEMKIADDIWGTARRIDIDAPRPADGAEGAG